MSSLPSSFPSGEAAALWLTETAAAFMRGPDNDLHMPGSEEPAFGVPLVGFARGDDPLWQECKKHVGEFHWTPREAFAFRYPHEPVDASELTVMSWVLPQTEATRIDNRKEKELPAERWARARIFGEKYVNAGLRKHLVATLDERGIQCVSPSLLDEWKGVDSPQFVFASTWSERHAAFAAGLGTFGLCDGLITPVGKAMRTGSIIVRMELPATERPYTNHQEYCLFYNSGTCGVCIKRCPASALSVQGHDKRACKQFLRGVTAPYVEETWHFKGYGCGLCQVGVPCEKGIPPRPKAKQTI